MSTAPNDLTQQLAASLELQRLIAPLTPEAQAAVRRIAFAHRHPEARDEPECPDAAAYWREHAPDGGGFAGTGLPADEPEVAVTFTACVSGAAGGKWDATVRRSDGKPPIRVGRFRDGDLAWATAERVAAELQEDVPR